MYFTHNTQHTHTHTHTHTHLGGTEKDVAVDQISTWAKEMVSGATTTTTTTTTTTPPPPLRPTAVIYRILTQVRSRKAFYTIGTKIRREK